MKAINSKFAFLGLASMSIIVASCSDSNTDNGSIINANIVGSAVKSTTDAQELAARVYNYKGINTGTETATAKTRVAVKTRAAAEVKIPDGATRLTKELINDNNWGKWNAHPGDYYVEDEEVSGDGMNIQGMNIYIKKGGKFSYGSAYNPTNSNITILNGGTLVAANSNEVFSTTNITNYGTILFPDNQNEYIIKSTVYDYTEGGLNLKGKVLNLQGGALLSVQKSLTAKEVKISGNNTQLNVTEDANVEEQFYMTNQTSAWVNNVLSCGNIKMDSQTTLHSGCAIKATNDVYITNGATLDIMYLKAANFKQDSNGILQLKDQSFVDIAGTYSNYNNGQGKTDLPDKNGVAVFKCNKLSYNAPGKQGDWNPGGAKTIDCSILSTSGDNAHIVVEAEGVYQKDGQTKVTDDNTTIVWSNNANIHWYTDADAKNYYIKKTACNGTGYNDPDANKEGESGSTTPEPTPTPDPVVPSPTPDPEAPETNNKPSLDLITSIDYDHDHDISATCIQPLNGRLYMSYHTRGDQTEANPTGHGGCVEVFTPVTNDKVTLEQYLYDTERDLDFNHLEAVKINSGERMVYLPGTSFKKGAMLAYMKIQDNHLLADQSQAITSPTDEGTVTYEQPLNFVQLGKAIEANRGTDENCVVYNDETNHLVVMTTKGYTIYDATTMETVGSYDKPGKAKHVAIGNGKIVTLRLDRQATNQSEAIPATIEVFDQRSENFDNPSASFSISTIEPNNGKNVIQVKDNQIYVCRGAAGLYCYDMNGNELWHYQMPSPINAQGNYKAYANGCYVGDKYIYIAYGSFGLVVLDKNTHEPIAYRATPKSANYVVEYDGYIYVAYGQSRLQVFKLCNVQ